MVLFDELLFMVIVGCLFPEDKFLIDDYEQGMLYGFMNGGQRNRSEKLFL